MTAFGVWAIPTAVVLIIGYGLMRGVRVFEVFLEGAKEGLEMSWRILPALVALVVAVGMFKASGGLDLLSFALSPLGRFLGLPCEVMPLALMRPVSGSGAMVVFTDLLKTYGPDSMIGRIASVMMGATETTFYTVALYYGAARVRDTRHTIPAAITADITGFFMSALAVRLLL